MVRYVMLILACLAVSCATVPCQSAEETGQRTALREEETGVQGQCVAIDPVAVIYLLYFN